MAMKEKSFLEKIRLVLKKSRGEPSKFIELLACILDLNRERETASYPKIVRRMWHEEWQQAKDKAAFEQVKWNLLLIRRREINERVFQSHLCFDLFIELSQDKQFRIITDPGEIFHKRLQELEQNLAKARSKANREKIRARIIELNDKFQESTKEKVKVINERSPAIKMPYKLSIAVTPFVNMSSDSDQEYFSNGITENIITALSNTPKVSVFVCNCLFACKDKTVELQQITREMGVRYLLKGSVQRIDNRVRISAQLIDTAVGHCLWAKSWDRDLRDIFVLQDEITMKIVEAIQVTLTEGRQALAWRKGANNIETYMKALQAHYHFELETIEDNIQAQQLAEQVIALDPGYATGYILLGNTYLWNLYLGVSDDWPQMTNQAFQLAQKALALDDSNYHANILFGMIYLGKRQYEQAIASIKHAADLNPNSPICLEALATVLSFAGNPEAALPLSQKALYLNGLPNSNIFFLLGTVYNLLGRYEEAITAFKNAANAQPHCSTLLHLGANYCALGHKHEARAAVNESLRINPNYTLENEKRMIGLYKDPADRAHLIDFLCKAGLK
jgi:TolB-like protein